jgi:hypothetical protein
MWDIPKMVDSALAIVDKFIPDKSARDKAEQDLRIEFIQLEKTQLQGQLEINKVEASNSNVFVSGWRPAIGWICGFAYSWSFVLQPMFSWVYVIITHNPSPALELNLSDLSFVLMAMLGIGGMRTYEKMKGISK